jgi:hypothetical protein
VYLGRGGQLLAADWHAIGDIRRRRDRPVTYDAFDPTRLATLLA